MEKLVEQIFTHISQGRLDREVGLELLKAIKLESGKQPPGGPMAIIGMSAKLPQAGSTADFWDHIRDGKDCIAPFPEARKQDIEGLIPFTYMKDREIRFTEGGFLDDIDKFDYKFFQISPKEASLMDPAQRLFLQVAWNALEDAGYGGDTLAGSRTGLYVGYSGWPMYGQFVSHAEPDAFELSVLGNISAIITKRLPQLLNLRGPSMLIDSSCSSSLVALHLAMSAIRNGECEQAVVGGIRLLLMPVEGSITYGIESKQLRAKVFDDEADGTILSEGVTAILIKPLHLALRDRDPVYAVVKGGAVNQDGSSTGVTTPNVQAQEDVLVRAWRDAGIDPETISYIEAMGTATKVGDLIEADALHKAFGRFTDKKQFCAIGSLKTNIGHTDSNAGLAAVIKAALALEHKQLPPTLHFHKPNRSIPFERSPIYVNDRLNDWTVPENTPRRCGISSFGFSGTNCHIVLEEAPGEQNGSEAAGPHLFTLSVKSEEALKELLKSYIRYAYEGSDLSLADLCYTANMGRGHYSYRLAMIVGDMEDFQRKLALLHDFSIEEQRTDACYRFGYCSSAQSESARLAPKVNDAIQQLEHARHDRDEERIRSLYAELSSLYTTGAAIPWERLYAGQARRRVHLPVYPFDRHRCWMKVPSPPTPVQKLGHVLKEDIVFNF